MLCNLIKKDEKITGMEMNTGEKSSVFDTLLNLQDDSANAFSNYVELKTETFDTWYGKGERNKQQEPKIGLVDRNTAYVLNDKEEKKYLSLKNNQVEFNNSLRKATSMELASKGILYQEPKLIDTVNLKNHIIDLINKYKNDTRFSNIVLMFNTILPYIDSEMLLNRYTSKDGLAVFDSNNNLYFKFGDSITLSNTQTSKGVQVYISTTDNRPEVLQKSLYTLLHETIHTVTVEALFQDKVFAFKIDELLAQARVEAKVSGQDFYGLTSNKEFVAEVLSNENFQQFLQLIDDKNSTSKKSMNLFDKLIEYIIAKIFGSNHINLQDGKEVITSASVLSVTLKETLLQIKEFKNTKTTAKESAEFLKLAIDMNNGIVRNNLIQTDNLQVDYSELADEELNTPLTDLDKQLDRVAQGRQAEVNRLRRINAQAEKKQAILTKEKELRAATDSGKDDAYRSLTAHEQGIISDYDYNKSLRLKSNKNYKSTYEEYIVEKAHQDWIERGIDPKIKIEKGSLGQVDMAEYIQQSIENNRSGAEKGIILGKTTEQYFSSSESKKIALQSEIDNVFVTSVKWRGRNKYFDWVKEIAATLPSRWNVGGTDKIDMEVNITSPILGLSGRADVMITRENGLLVIRDIKTGTKFMDVHNLDMMLYGAQANRQIMNTELNRAKLQVIYYAFMRMVENPGTQFESLGIDWMPYESYAKDTSISDITLNRDEISSFLGMIQDYYKDNKTDPKKENVWNQIKERSDIFNSGNYTQSMYKNTGKDMKPAYNTQQEEFKDRLARLKSNVMFNPNLQDYKKMAFDPKKETIRSNYNTIKEDVERLTEMISGGEIPGKALASFSEDLTSMNYYLGTLANTGNPIVETFHKLFEARMNAYRKAILEDEQNLNHYLLPLVNQQRKKKNLSTINNDKDMRKYISSINVIDLYGHLYLEYKDTEGNTRRGLKRLESDMQDLTDIDKSMLKFLNAHYDSFFENTPNNIALLNRAYTYRLNQFGEYEELSALDVYNGKSYRKQGQEQRNWNYKDQTFTSEQAKLTGKKNVGWIPKIAPTEDELLNQFNLVKITYDANGLPKIEKAFNKYSIEDLRNTANPTKYLSAAYWKLWYKTRLSDFWENEYRESDVDDEGGVPVKGLGGKITSQNLSYSLDIEAQFMQFTNQMRKKENLDDVYALGKGLAFYLDEYNSGLKNNQTAQLLSKFLEAHVRDKIQELPNKIGDFSFFSRITQFRSINPDPNRGDAKYSFYNLSSRKLIRYLKRSATGAIMFLSPVSSFVNAMQAYTASLRKGLAQSAADKFHLIGTDKLRSVTDFSAGAYHTALGDATRIITSSIRGKDINDEKGWLISKQIGFLPDNMEYQNSYSLFSGSWKAANPSHGYLLQGIPEEINSIAIMIAQLKSQIVKSDNPKYNGKSMWDIYEIKEIERTLSNGEVIKIKEAVVPSDFIRGYETDFEGNETKVSGITNFEATKMKRVYERIQGGYRQEEKTILETTLLGELFIQFRKFVPSMLRDQMGSQKTDYSLGSYENKKVLSGDGTEKEVLEWKKRVIEGRFRVIARMLFGTIMLGKAGFMVPANLKSGLEQNSTMQNRWRWSDMNPDQQLMVIDTLTILALWASPAIVLFNARKTEDDDDSYLKLLTRIASDIIQPLNPINSMRLLLSPEPVGGKVLMKRLGAYSQLVFDALLVVTGNEQDIYTQRGDVRGLRDAFRYTPRLPAAVYKSYDFVTHKKNDFMDLILQTSFR